MEQPDFASVTGNLRLVAFCDQYPVHAIVEFLRRRRSIGWVGSGPNGQILGFYSDDHISVIPAVMWSGPLVPDRIKLLI
jgi:hypothetical protein